jgi:hypothetical protein
MGSCPTNGSSNMIKSGSSAMALASAARRAIPRAQKASVSRHRSPTASSFIITVLFSSGGFVCRAADRPRYRTRHVGEQCAGLKQHAHAFARYNARATHRGDVFAVKEDFAASGGICPPIRTQGSFYRSGRPHDGGDFTARAPSARYHQIRRSSREKLTPRISTKFAMSLAHLSSFLPDWVKHDRITALTQHFYRILPYELAKAGICFTFGA